MKLNRRTVKKLASLSALGAGALALTADKAEATIISTNVNTTVGFSPGSVSTWGSGILPGSSSASLFFRTSGFASTNNGARSVSAGSIGKFVKFAGYSAGERRILSTFNAGAVLGGQTVSSHVLAGRRFWSTFLTGATSSSTFTARSNGATFHSNGFTDKFALFSYTGNSGPLFGWVELSYAVNGSFGPDATFGPDLTIIAYGVDDSGAPIAAGDTGGATTTPEPSAVYMSGLGALVLGAEGLRRWRATRKQAATVPAA